MSLFNLFHKKSLRDPHIPNQRMRLAQWFEKQRVGKKKTTIVVGCQRKDVTVGLVTPSFSSYLLSFSVRHRFMELDFLFFKVQVTLTWETYSTEFLSPVGAFSLFWVFPPTSFIFGFLPRAWLSISLIREFSLSWDRLGLSLLSASGSFHRDRLGCSLSFHQLGFT